MVENKTIIWGIHAVNTEQANTFFLKAKIKECYPDEIPGAIPHFAGQLFCFVHEMKPGDLVVYPLRRDLQIHLGRVPCTYIYDPNVGSHYPQLRSIDWHRSQLLGIYFTQSAIYEIGSAITLFQVKNYAEEFRAASEGMVAPPQVTEDETIARVVEDIEQTTRDFVLKRLAQEYKGHPLTQFVAQLLRTMGYVSEYHQQSLMAV